MECQLDLEGWAMPPWKLTFDPLLSASSCCCVSSRLVFVSTFVPHLSSLSAATIGRLPCCAFGLRLLLDGVFGLGHEVWILGHKLSPTYPHCFHYLSFPRHSVLGYLAKCVKLHHHLFLSLPTYRPPPPPPPFPFPPTTTLKGLLPLPPPP